MTEPRKYTREWAAQELGVHINTIDNLRREGILPYTKIGKSIRIYGEDIEGCKRINKVGPTMHPLHGRG